MAEKKKKINPKEFIVMPPLPMVLVNAENDRQNAKNGSSDLPDTHPVSPQEVKKIIDRLNKEKEKNW